MIYGLHTTEIPPSQIKTLETFMYKNIRAMMNPGWREDKWYPEKRQLYEKIQQPTMETWLEKTQIMTMLTQTREKKTIHPKHCQEMMRPKNKLLEQWRKRHASLQKDQKDKKEREQTEEPSQESTQEQRQGLTRKLTKESTGEHKQETTKRKITREKTMMINM